MTALLQQTCTACDRSAKPATDAERNEWLAQLPAWTIVEREGIPRLERAFAFSDFATALAFTNRIGALAEAEQHHPAILTEWGRVTVTLWTHAIKALHPNDFILAAKIDQIPLH